MSSATLAGLQRATDDLAIAYHRSVPMDLLPQVRRHLRYAGRLLDKRMPLRQRRELLSSTGWLCLLTATLHIDMNQREAAARRLDTAREAAQQAGHTEITAWCLETQAWDALTEGQYQEAVALSQAAARIAPPGGSAVIQATAQEGRTWARLGDRPATATALARVERLAAPLPVPDSPEHHYRYDPAKAQAYLATTLSWAGDPAAVRVAEQTLAALDPAGDGGPRPRRTVAARIDLAHALVAAGRPDEAAGQAMNAIGSGRIVPSNRWRIAEVVAGVDATGCAAAAELRDAYQDMLTAVPGPPLINHASD